MKIDHELQKLDLSPKTAKVYRAILELGFATSMDIAKRTRIKRTTVYDHVVELIDKGYISEGRRGRRRIFVPEDPKHIESRLEEKLLRAKELIPVLALLHAKKSPKPNIRFYSGINGQKIIMEELLQMKGKEQLWWSSLTDLIDLLGRKYLRQWVTRRVKRGLFTKVLRTPETRETEHSFTASNAFMREVRWLPAGFVFDGALAIFDDKVAYISSRAESFGFIIESLAFAKMLRLIFLSMWTVAEPK